jgi:hypothetical protein
MKPGMSPCSRILLKNILAGLAFDCKNKKRISDTQKFIRVSALKFKMNLGILD